MSVREDTTVTTIQAETLTREAFAPFGDILSKDGLERLPIDIYGDRANVYVPSAFESDQPTEFLLTHCRLREFRVIFMERHVELTQSFIPLRGDPFLIVVAPPGCEEVDGMPAFDVIRAFIVAGSCGINLKRGTWHEFPFPLVDDLDLIVTSHQSLTEGLKSSLDERKEIFRLDVEKRNFSERADVLVRVGLP